MASSKARRYLRPVEQETRCLSLRTADHLESQLLQEEKIGVTINMRLNSYAKTRNLCACLYLFFSFGGGRELVGFGCFLLFCFILSLGLKPLLIWQSLALKATPFSFMSR